MNRYNAISTYEDATFVKELEDLNTGCFTFVLEFYDEEKNLKAVEPIVLHKFDNAVSSMVDKENLISLQLRYLNAEERENSKGIYGADNKKELYAVIK